MLQQVNYSPNQSICIHAESLINKSIYAINIYYTIYTVTNPHVCRECHHAANKDHGLTHTHTCKCSAVGILCILEWENNF